MSCKIKYDNAILIATGRAQLQSRLAISEEIAENAENKH